MTYNSYVLLKGVRESIVMSRANADHVRIIWENKEIENDFVINIGGRKIFSKGQIRFVEVIADGRELESWDEERRKAVEDEQKARKYILSIPIEIRARRLEVFDLFFRAATGLPASPELREKASAVQLQFFRENPRRMICDPRLWKSLIDGAPRTVFPDERTGDAVRIGRLMPRSTFKMIEGILSCDLRLSGHKYEQHTAA